MGRQSRASNVLVRGPLGPFAEAYGRALVERRYTLLSAVNLQRQVAHLSNWLDVQGIAVGQINEASIEAFFAFQRSSGRDPSCFRDPDWCACWSCYATLGW